MNTQSVYKRLLGLSRYFVSTAKAVMPELATWYIYHVFEESIQGLNQTINLFQ